MDLPVGTDTLVGLAGDEDADLTTSGEAVRHGETLDFWGS